MNTRQALQASRAITPNVLEATIFSLRAQLSEQLETARKALEGDDFELAAIQLGHASKSSQALYENLELERANAASSRCMVGEASDETLAGELIRRAEKGEGDAKTAILAAAKRLTQPKRKGGARGAA